MRKELKQDSELRLSIECNINNLHREKLSFLEEATISELSNKKALYLIKEMEVSENRLWDVVYYVREELHDSKLTAEDVDNLLNNIVIEYACSTNLASQVVGTIHEMADTLNEILGCLKNPLGAVVAEEVETTEDYSDYGRPVILDTLEAVVRAANAKAEMTSKYQSTDKSSVESVKANSEHEYTRSLETLDEVIQSIKDKVSLNMELAKQHGTKEEDFYKSLNTPVKTKLKPQLDKTQYEKSYRNFYNE